LQSKRFKIEEMKSLIVFDFDGTIIDENSAARIFEILPKEVKRDGFRHYVELFENASEQVKNFYYCSLKQLSCVSFGKVWCNEAGVTRRFEIFFFKK
jgi:Putative Phosphatase